MDCVVDFRHEDREYAVHFDLTAFEDLEREGFRGVRKLFAQIEDLEVAALKAAMRHGLAGYGRLCVARGEPRPEAVKSAGELCMAFGLKESSDVLVAALSMAAVRTRPKGEPAADAGAGAAAEEPRPGAG